MPWEGLAPLSAREDAKVARLWPITAVPPAVSVAGGLVVPAIHLPDGMAEISAARRLNSSFAGGYGRSGFGGYGRGGYGLGGYGRGYGYGGRYGYGRGFGYGYGRGLFGYGYGRRFGYGLPLFGYGLGFRGGLISSLLYGFGGYGGYGGYGLGGYGGYGGYGLGGYGGYGGGYGSGYGYGYGGNGACNNWGYGSSGYSNGYAYNPSLNGNSQFANYNLSTIAPSIYAGATQLAANVSLAGAQLQTPVAVATGATADPTAFADKGEQAFRAGDYKSAVYAFQHAAVDDAQNPVITMLLGQSLFATGKFDEAAGATQAAMQQLPKDKWGVVASNYKELYGSRQDYTDQLRALEKNVKDKPADPALRFLLGFHYAYLGFPQQAVEQLDKVLKIAPADEMAKQLRDEMKVKLPNAVVPAS